MLNNRKIQIFKRVVPKRLHSILTALLGLGVFLIMAAPLLLQSPSRVLQALGTGIYIFLDPVCHQLPDRSLFLGDVPFPVCARCLFIYAGGFVVFLLAHLQKTPVYWSKYTYAGIALLVGAELFTEKILGLNPLLEFRILGGLLMGALIFRFALESIFLTGEKKF